MCQIRMLEEVRTEVIYAWNEDAGTPLESREEILRQDEEYQASIYDCDGSEVCIQFAKGEIVIGLRMKAFRVLDRCHSCDDPAHPDPDRVGPLGHVPRWIPERWATEALLTRLTLDRLRQEGAGRRAENALDDDSNGKW